MIEARPNMIKKYNKPAVGLLCGIILPIIAFIAFFSYAYFTGENISLIDYFNMLKETDTIIPILSVCILPNLILYFIFKKIDYWYAIKGVIISVFIYTILVVVIKFA